MATRLNVKYRKIDSLRAYKRNARTHSKKQIKQLAASIKEFGFINPLLITRDGELIAGHGRWEAAKLAGLSEVPTIVIDDLTTEQRRAYILADNKLALNAGWDTELLALELGELADLGLGELAGFSTTELDLVLDGARAADAEREELAPEDAQVDLPEQAVTRPGDLWQLGRHVLLCGDARKASDLERVTLSEDMDAIFTDPPYNCKIDGHVCGLGKVKHREFAMASGEMPTELAELIKSETERLLTLTDGGKPITIPALQAVLRATVVSAAKGNPHAQRIVLQMAKDVQAQEAKVRQDLFEQAMLMKIQLEHDRDVWVARGRAETEMPCHPSDIEINRETGEVRNFLLFTREEVEARECVIRLRDFFIEQMPQMLRTLREDGDDPFLELGRESARTFIERANAELPSRFRRPLPGESQPLGAEATPEEIWRSWASELASVLCRREPD